LPPSLFHIEVNACIILLYLKTPLYNQENKSTNFNSSSHAVEACNEVMGGLAKSVCYIGGLLYRSSFPCTYYYWAEEYSLYQGFYYRGVCYILGFHYSTMIYFQDNREEPAWSQNYFGFWEAILYLHLSRCYAFKSTVGNPRNIVRFL